MEFTSRKTRVIGFAATAALLVGVAVLTMAGSVSAQAGPGASCTGDSTTNFGSEFFGFDDFGNRLLSTSPTVREFALSAPLVAGTYALDGVAYDGYPGRELIDPQPREQWYAVLLSGDGTVLATSGTTGDVADGVVEATWAGSLGEVTIDQTAVSVQIVHASPGSISINSVRPVCLGATGGPVEPEPEPTPPPSSVVVDYDSVNLPAANVLLVCGEREESATGTAVDLLIDGVEASAACSVTYTPGNRCTVAVNPEATKTAMSDGAVSIAIPATGDTSVIIDIDCQAAVAAPTTTTTTAPPAVDTEVEGQVETPTAAPTAQVQPGTPAFTG